MSSFKVLTAASSNVLQFYRNFCEQFLVFRRAHFRSNVLSTAFISRDMRHRKCLIGLNARGLMCLTRLLVSRFVESHRPASLSVKNLEVSVPFLVDVVKSSKDLPTLAFTGTRASKLPLRDEPGPSGGYPDKDNDSNEQQPLRLMAYREIVWPNPFKTLRNYLFSFLIRGYFDDKFSIDGFLFGAEQAVAVISDFISRGQFDELEGLVTREAIQEVRYHYMRLSQKQRNFVAVNPKDFFSRFVFEIGMIFDDNTDQRFVEITTVFQGFHGLEDLKVKSSGSMLEEMYKTPEQMYICNYRFIREFTKGKEDDWTVNKLNHFLPTEHARR